MTFTCKTHWVCLGITAAGTDFELDVDPRDASGEAKATLRLLPDSIEIVSDATADQMEELGAALIEAARLMRSGQLVREVEA